MNEKFDKAQSLRNNGKIDEAISLYQQVRDEVKSSDQNLASECLHMIGVAYYQAGKFEEIILSTKDKRVGDKRELLGLSLNQLKQILLSG